MTLREFVGWAKALLRRAHRSSWWLSRGGHASLCPPYILRSARNDVEGEAPILTYRPPSRACEERGATLANANCSPRTSRARTPHAASQRRRQNRSGARVSKGRAA